MCTSDWLTFALVGWVFSLLELAASAGDVDPPFAGVCSGASPSLTTGLVRPSFVVLGVFSPIIWLTMPLTNSFCKDAAFLFTPQLRVIEARGSRRMLTVDPPCVFWVVDLTSMSPCNTIEVCFRGSRCSNTVEVDCLPCMLSRFVE